MAGRMSRPSSCPGRSRRPGRSRATGMDPVRDPTTRAHLARPARSSSTRGRWSALEAGGRQVVVLGAGDHHSALRFRHPASTSTRWTIRRTQAGQAICLERKAGRLTGARHSCRRTLRHDDVGRASSSVPAIGPRLPTLVPAEGLLIYLDEEAWSTCWPACGPGRRRQRPGGQPGRPPEGVDSASASRRGPMPAGPVRRPSRGAPSCPRRPTWNWWSGRDGGSPRRSTTPRSTMRPSPADRSSSSPTPEDSVAPGSPGQPSRSGGPAGYTGA